MIREHDKKPGNQGGQERNAKAMIQSSFFSSFFDDPKKCSESGSYVHSYPAQTEIYQQGASAETVYLIEGGIVKLTRLLPNGRELIAGLCRKPRLIGSPDVILEQPYSYTATTLVRSSLLFIPAEAFLHLAKTDGQFSCQVNRILSQEIFDDRRRLEAISCMPARDRLELLLRELLLEQEADELHRSGEILVPLKHHELAEIIAVTPEHLCRLLKELEEERVIKRSKGMLIVTDFTGLLQKTES